MASAKIGPYDKGYWQQVEAYISQHSEITFTHSICPDCAEEYERQFGPRKQEREDE